MEHGELGFALGCGKKILGVTTRVLDTPPRGNDHRESTTFNDRDQST